MTRKDLKRKIKRKKLILNFFLLFLRRTNPLIVNLSQDLDKFIVKEQKYLISKSKILKDKNKKTLKKVA